MHYYRRRRNGTYGLLQRPEKVTHSNGYILVQANGSTLANGRFRQYEHRMVYYEAHGKGPFLCHWCGKEVTWATMDIDHLDDDKANNHPDNLVASCPLCNRLRGKHKMIASVSKWLEFNGERITVKELAKRLGITGGSIHWRLKHGWPLDKIFNEPRGKFGPRSGRSGCRG